MGVGRVCAASSYKVPFCTLAALLAGQYVVYASLKAATWFLPQKEVCLGVSALRVRLEF
jgi:hypothetical protein